jgi:hypothetical protein
MKGKITDDASTERMVWAGRLVGECAGKILLNCLIEIKSFG